MFNKTNLTKEKWEIYVRIFESFIDRMYLEKDRKLEKGLFCRVKMPFGGPIHSLAVLSFHPAFPFIPFIWERYHAVIFENWEYAFLDFDKITGASLYKNRIKIFSNEKIKKAIERKIGKKIKRITTLRKFKRELF